MERWRKRFWILLAIVLAVPFFIVICAAARFLPDRAVTYANVEEHFKYGSTGGERASGFPLYLWKALPVVFADRLPQNGAPGWEAFGFVFEKDANGKPRELPVGVMRRRNLGLDRVFLNCAACHHSTVRLSPDDAPRVISAMPAARFDIGRFEQFLFDIVADERFDAEDLVPEIERQAGGLSALDKYVIYPIAISLMRDRVMMLRQRFTPLHPPSWGPGRVDTFNAARALFNFPFHRVPPEQLVGAADFPSIWNQGPREGMQLHWDGNNCRVDERNKSAAFGTGTTPATIDLRAIERIANWLLTFKPPPWPYPVDAALRDRGKALYLQLCADCHGRSGSDFTSNCANDATRDAARRQCEEQGKDVPYGACVGKVLPLERIGTDPYRLWSYGYDIAANQGLLYANVEYPGRPSERFRHFRKTYGYANQPLDGIWLRAPYLHNGSVPTLRDLLEPASARPRQFYRGYDVIDRVKVGFVANVAEERGRRFFLFRTRDAAGNLIPGNGNQGHEYGTALPPRDKDAIVEYLKTF